MKKLFVFGMALGMVGVAVVYLIFLKLNPSKAESQTEKVEDQVRGITFFMPKSFHQTDTQDLKAKNSLFIYGFTPPDVEGVECFVSQTKNPREGDVTLQYLRSGLEGQFKRAYGAFTTEKAEIVDLGIAKGVRLSVKYKVGENNFKITEVVGTDGKITTFVSCSAPLGLFPLYQDQFAVLLNSFKLIKQ